MFAIFAKRGVTIALLLAIVAGFIGLSIASFTNQELINYSAENKLIESLSAAFLILAAVFGAAMAFSKYQGQGWSYFAFLMAVGAAREMDGHKAWTTMSIFKSRFYVSPEVPFYEKVIGFMVIIALLYCIYQVAKKLKAGLCDFWQGRGYAVSLFTGLGFFALAKTLDAFFRLFPWLQGGSLEEYTTYMRYSEESLEMFGAFLLLMVPVLYMRKRRKR